MIWRIFSVALMAGVACTRVPPACPTAPSGPSAPRLDRCIEPPWVPTSGAMPHAPGWTAENCGDTGTWGFVHHGNRILSETDLAGIDLRDLVLETKAVYGFEVGDYWCAKRRGEQQPLPALKLRLRLCGVSVEEVFNRVAASVSNQRLADAAFAIDVFVGGVTGPRCAHDDPRCGPESNAMGREGGRCLETVPIASGPIADRVRGHCGHDGECQITCESFCVSWTEQPLCSKEPRAPGEEEAWCGCVAGRCAWLRRPAQSR